MEVDHLEDLVPPEEAAICRVCRSEGTPTNPLFYPCKCSGSIRFIHQDCLTQWLQHSGKKYCEVCKFEFKFSSVYSMNMPEQLPLRVVLWRGVKIILGMLAEYLRYIIVLAVWLALVPIFSSLFYKTMFDELKPWQNETLSYQQKFVHADYKRHLVDGWTLCFVIVFIGFAGLMVREYIMENSIVDEPEDIEEFLFDLDEEPVIRRVPEPVHWTLNPLAEALASSTVIAEADQANNEPDEFQMPVDAIDHLERREHAEQPQEEQEPLLPPPVPLEQLAAQLPPQAEPNQGEEEADFDNEDFGLIDMIGLRGDLVELAKNAMFVLILMCSVVILLLFIPFKLGSLAISASGKPELIIYSLMDRLPVVIVGYMIIVAFVLSNILLLNKISNDQTIANWTSALKRHLNFIFISVKVFTLTFIELIVFPFICGLMINFLSIPMTHSIGMEALVDRFLIPVRLYKVFFCFLTWFTGTLFMFQFALMIQMVRKSHLRKGLMWFIRDPSDEDFNPIQEMIQQEFVKQLEKICTSLMVYALVLLSAFVVPSFLCLVTGFKFRMNYLYVVSDYESALLVAAGPYLFRKLKLKILYKNLWKQVLVQISRYLGMSQFVLDNHDNTYTGKKLFLVLNQDEIKLIKKILLINYTNSKMKNVYYKVRCDEIQEEIVVKRQVRGYFFLLNPFFMWRDPFLIELEPKYAHLIGKTLSMKLVHVSRNEQQPQPINVKCTVVECPEALQFHVWAFLALLILFMGLINSQLLMGSVLVGRALTKCSFDGYNFLAGIVLTIGMLRALKFVKSFRRPVVDLRALSGKAMYYLQTTFHVANFVIIAFALLPALIAVLEITVFMRLSSLISRDAEIEWHACRMYSLDNLYFAGFITCYNIYTFNKLVRTIQLPTDPSLLYVSQLVQDISLIIGNLDLVLLKRRIFDLYRCVAYTLCFSVLLVVSEVTVNIIFHTSEWRDMMRALCIPVVSLLYLLWHAMPALSGGFRWFIDRIREDEYVVGRELINYE